MNAFQFKFFLCINQCKTIKNQCKTFCVEKKIVKRAFKKLQKAIEEKSVKRDWTEKNAKESAYENSSATDREKQQSPILFVYRWFTLGFMY